VGTGNTKGLGEFIVEGLCQNTVVVIDCVLSTIKGFHIKPVSVSIKQTSIEIPITSN
jgi:hypothetical protein